MKADTNLMTIAATTLRLVAMTSLLIACGPPAVSGGGGAADAGAQPGNDAGSQPGTDAGTTPGDDCPDEHFLDVTQSPGPGGNYADPSLAVRCTADEVIVESNGMPHYRFDAITPNPLGEQDYEWHFPKVARAGTEEATIPLLGAVAVVINGLPVYGPNEAERPDPFGDPVHNQILDRCAGHTGGTQDYHYHTLLANCLADETAADEASKIWAFSLDGYAIYGPKGCADADCSRVITHNSSWVQTGDPSTYAWDNHEYRANTAEGQLDRCNGHTGPNGDYHYHVTESFPYVLGCYHGVPTANGGGGGGGGGPPQEAQDACQGSSEGDACSFAGRGGGTVTGACRTVQGVLACVPARP
jgi:hypothetical protein